MLSNSDKTCTAKLEVAIESLIHVLSARDGMLRQSARQALVAIGEPAVGALAVAMRDRNTNVRWESTKALAEIGDPATAPDLVNALEDESFSVRWLAAEGLIAMGSGALGPLLRALIQRPDSVWLREGAHHVLRTLGQRGYQNIVQGVVEALAELQGIADLVPNAESALAALERERPEHHTHPAEHPRRSEHDSGSTPGC